MILYTIQPESIWIHLKTHEHFYAELNKSLFLLKSSRKTPDFNQGI